MTNKSSYSSLVDWLAKCCATYVGAISDLRNSDADSVKRTVMLLEQTAVTPTLSPTVADVIVSLMLLDLYEGNSHFTEAEVEKKVETALRTDPFQCKSLVNFASILTTADMDHLARRVAEIVFKIPADLESQIGAAEILKAAGNVENHSDFDVCLAKIKSQLESLTGRITELERWDELE